jgi:hypothetical protein
VAPGVASLLLRHGCGAPHPLAHEPSGFVAFAPCRTVRPDQVPESRSQAKAKSKSKSTASDRSVRSTRARWSLRSKATDRSPFYRRLLLLCAVWGTTQRMSCRVVRRFGFFFAAVFIFCSLSLVDALGSGQASPTQAPGDEGEKKPDYSKEGYVIEQTRSRFRFESDGKGREENSVRVRVQSEAGVSGEISRRVGAAAHGEV